MKKIYAIAALLLLSIVSFAYDGKGIYSKYSDSKDVSAVYISPAMFKMIGRLPDMRLGEGSRNFTPVLKSLKGMYVLNTSSSATGTAISADVSKMVKKEGYEMIMEAKENGETVRMYTVSSGDVVTSLLMLETSSSETTFICLDGVMSMEALMKLVE